MLDFTVPNSPGWGQRVLAAEGSDEGQFGAISPRMLAAIETLRGQKTDMIVKPIETESDYDLALKEIEGLFGAPMGSEASDRLEVLVTLVQGYEAKNHPIGLPSAEAVAEYEAEKRGTKL